MFDFRSTSPEKNQDKERDVHEDADESPAKENTDKTAEVEQKSRSASPAPKDEENHANNDDAD